MYKNSFKSNVTGKHFIFSHGGTFNCKSKNIIYLIECECGKKYIGRTIQECHERLNGHQSSAKNKNTYIYKHFQNDDHKYDNASIQII